MDKQKKELQTKRREKKKEMKHKENIRDLKEKKIKYWREGRKKIELKMFSDMYAVKLRA